VIQKCSPQAVGAARAGGDRNRSDYRPNAADTQQVQDETDLCAHALAAHARGWSVFPVYSVDPNDPRKTKSPAVAWKPLQRTIASRRTLIGWFSRPHVDSIGVICGKVSGGLVVRDFDDTESYERWATENKDIAEMLPTVRTCRGYHVYFRAGLLKSHKCGDGEYRAEGNFVAMPPSKHASGSLYRWIVELPDGKLPEIDPIAVGLTDGTCHTVSTVNASQSMSMQVSSSRPPKVPTEQILARNNVRNKIREAIEAACPTGFGQRNARDFEFVRRLKAIKELEGVDPMDLEPVCLKWHERTLPFMRDMQDFESRFSEFLRSWDGARHAFGEGVVELAFQRAQSEPLPPEATQFPTHQTRLLVALCRELQRLHGEEPFYLSCDKAAAVLDVRNSSGKRDLKKVWRWLQLLLRKGLLELHARGTASGNQRKGRASEYFYRGRL
jgi:hypothetical protein